MKKQTSPLFKFVFILALAQFACNAPSAQATPDTLATLSGLYTSSAQTQQVSGTSTPGLPVPTETPFVIQTSTPFILQSPAPVTRCDAAEFVADVTYPDGSVIPQSNSFVKIWRIRNAGTCTWTSSYALVFTGGDQLNGASSIPLNQTVNPGSSIDLAVNLSAPGKEGSYRGYWKLRNASGALFGIGYAADTAFWVDIRVKGPSYIAYNFAEKFCDANWENNNAGLPCPGIEDDPQGYVLKIDKPKLEDGIKRNEPGLLTVPRNKNNGIISAQFPAFKVQAGDRFRALIGCYQNSAKCNVIFTLEYKNNGVVKTLGSWHEISEGQLYPIDLDLSSLKGETVKFILRVSANGEPKGDNAVWLNPQIIRQGTAPTATPTFTFTPTATYTPTATDTPSPTLTPSETPTP